MSRTKCEVFNFKSICTVYVAIKRILDRGFLKKCSFKIISLTQKSELYFKKLETAASI